MLQKRWFGGIMTCLCLTYSVILPIVASGMQISQVNRMIAKSQPKKTISKPVDIQPTVQPPLKDKLAADNTENSTQATSPVQAVTPTPQQAVTAQPAVTLSNYQFEMLVRIISAEAKGEPLEGQVAVGAVILNRIKSGRFPDTVSENVLKPGEFEPVANGHIWGNPTSTAYRAARLAVNGWDPSYGALYFYNPAKSTSPWIWSRHTITRIGDHIFAV